MKKYNIGDKVWQAVAERREVPEACPVCYGKMRVTLILGNGDQVSLSCDYCGRGYNNPTGQVSEIQFFAGAELRIIDKVSSEHNSDGEEIRYQSGYNILYPENIFDTEQEALDRCVEIAEQLTKDEKSKSEYLKADIKKSFAWNAGHHLREAKQHENLAAIHKEKAILCKNKEAKA